jgi:membrane protein
MHPWTRKALDRTPRRLRPGVELVVRTIDDTFDDRVPGLAAEVAFFVLLSLPPLLLTLLAGAGVVGQWVGASWRPELAQVLRDAAQTIFSDATMTTTVTPLLDRLVQDADASVFGISFVITFVSASRALRVVSAAITIAYDLETTRPPWQQRLWGFALTFGALVVGIGLVPLLVAGPGLGELVSDWAGGITGLDEVWRAVYWPAAGVVVTVLMGVLYHLAAPWWTRFRRDLPGAVLAMALWLAGTVALRVYVGQTIAEDAIYEPIAGPLIVLLWLYVSAFAVLLGAEFNAEIEKMWPSRPHLHPAVAGAFMTDGQGRSRNPLARRRKPPQSSGDPTVALPAAHTTRRTADAGTDED